MNKKISNIQRFLTLLFTDKDLGEVLSVEKEEIIPFIPEQPQEEKPFHIQPEDV